MQGAERCESEREEKGLVSHLVVVGLLTLTVEALPPLPLMLPALAFRFAGAGAEPVSPSLLLYSGRAALGDLRVLMLLLLAGEAEPDADGLFEAVEVEVEVEVDLFLSITR